MKLSFHHRGALAWQAMLNDTTPDRAILYRFSGFTFYTMEMSTLTYQPEPQKADMYPLFNKKSRTRFLMFVLLCTWLNQLGRLTFSPLLHYLGKRKLLRYNLPLL